MKIYKSTTIISISVQLVNGKSKHIAFDGMSDGSGIYFCNDPKVQKAIESSRYYGGVISLVSDDSNATASAKTEATEAVDNEKKSASGAFSYKKAAEKQKNVKEFASIDDAKDWLAEEYAISRTKMRGEKAVIEAGKEAGVEIIIK